MPSLKHLRWVLLLQAAVWFLCLTAEGISRYVLHLPDPYQFFMLHGDATFSDFSLWLPRFGWIHSAQFFTFAGPPYLYPAPAGLFYAAFLPFGPRSNLAFGVALLLTFAAAGCLFARALGKRGVPSRVAFPAVLAGVAMSYPFWYDFQRGNIEIWVWSLSALGVWAFLRGRGYSAAACFGAAGSIKLYPFAYLGLFLLRRQWRQLALGVAPGLAVTFASLWVLDPDIIASAHGIGTGLSNFAFIYTRNVLPFVTGFDHSLYTLVKRFSGEGHLARFPRVYVACAGLTLLIVFFTRVRRLPTTSQIVAITAAIILFPPVSFDYTLLHAYTALGLLLLTGDHTAGTRRQLFLLAVICSPLTEFIYRGSTFGGQLKAVALLGVFLLAISTKSPGEPHADLPGLTPCNA